MALHAPGTASNPAPSRCAPQHGDSCRKADAFGDDLRLLFDSVAQESERRLPVHGITRKQMKRIVLACVSRMYPAFCTVTASGLFMRPSASSLFCFYGFQRIFREAPHRTRTKRFSEPSANAELRH